MKKLIILLLLSFTAIFVACNKDEVIEEKVIAIQATFAGQVKFGDELTTHISSFKGYKLFDSGRKESITISKDMISGFDTSKEGNIDVVISYMNFNTVITINVTNPLTSYDVVIDESITYLLGMPIEHYFEALSIKGHYKNGETKLILPNDISIISEFILETVDNKKNDYVQLTLDIEGIKKSIVVENKSMPISNLLNVTNDIDELMENYTFPDIINIDLIYLGTVKNTYAEKIMIQEGPFGNKISINIPKEEFKLNFEYVGSIEYKITMDYSGYTELVTNKDKFRTAIRDTDPDSIYFEEYLGNNNYVIVDEATPSRTHIISKEAFIGKKIERLVLKDSIDIIEDNAFIDSWETIRELRLKASLVKLGAKTEADINQEALNVFLTRVFGSVPNNIKVTIMDVLPI